MPFEPASDILSAYTVLDLTRVRSGPTCIRQLADWGANVIKIEDPESDKVGLGGPRSGSDFQNLHRNKLGLSLNLKDPEGLAILKEMVKQAVDAGMDVELDAGLAIERRLFQDVVETDDSRVGVASFLEHGPGKAAFTGR